MTASGKTALFLPSGSETDNERENLRVTVGHVRPLRLIKN